MVKLNMGMRRIDFDVEHFGKRAFCAECRFEHQPIYDRVWCSWDNLEFLQFDVSA
ncbi:hypothetical protein [Thauera phenolivorans]|uniref:hypothetical protein n=1 Tax=Thauera phenolivorans TaxID=1792543 RepID=UPI00130138E7|nr:hypothetical protein [Thauera phenolivorans]